MEGGGEVNAAPLRMRTFLKLEKNVTNKLKGVMAYVFGPLERYFLPLPLLTHVKLVIVVTLK